MIGTKVLVLMLQMRRQRVQREFIRRYFWEGKDMENNIGNGATTAQENTKFCKHCGAKIPAAAVICTQCGCQVEEMKNAETPNIVINNSNMNTNTNTNTNTKTNTIHLLILKKGLRNNRMELFLILNWKNVVIWININYMVN